MPKEITVDFRIDRATIDQLIKAMGELGESARAIRRGPVQVTRTPRREEHWVSMWRGNGPVAPGDEAVEFLGLEALVGNDARRMERQLAAANEMERLRVKRPYASWERDYKPKTPCLTE